ncbi:hypothetical protein B0H13DRAFT_2335190 [Mycena leptocephala]|nr:hypothetical protein B0H13DRAFT_2335190 [Mycena leptocephala]
MTPYCAIHEAIDPWVRDFALPALFIVTFCRNIDFILQAHMQHDRPLTHYVSRLPTNPEHTTSASLRYIMMRDAESRQQPNLLPQVPCILVIFIYDSLLTLDSEVEHMWVSEHKLGSAWFFFIRYCALGSNIVMSVMKFGDFAPEVSTSRSFLQSFTLIPPRRKSVVALTINYWIGLMPVQQLAVGCTLILRVYAMYNCDKRILTLLIISGLVTVAVGAWSIMPSGPSPTVQTTVPGCHIGESQTQLIPRHGTAWEAELVCNMIILGLTVYRAFTQARAAITFADSLWHVMMRVMYFGIICLANLANILMFNLGGMITSSDLAGFTSTVSVVMISRLSSNLRAAASSPTIGDGFTYPAQQDTLHFVQSTATGLETSGR